MITSARASRADSITPSTPVAARQSRSPGRNAAHCPGRPLHPQGHPKILSNRSAESIFGTHPCARSLCRPSGPGGKGQARGQALNARGEPPRAHRRYQEDRTSSLTASASEMASPCEWSTFGVPLRSPRPRRQSKRRISPSLPCMRHGLVGLGRLQRRWRCRRASGAC
jgi:hypothetical protein